MSYDDWVSLLVAWGAGNIIIGGLTAIQISELAGNLANYDRGKKEEENIEHQISL
jgi:hypothetical protein